MRKVTYGAACSFNGYIARPDGSVDWLVWSKDVARLTSSYWERVDAVLMGRKTYEVARAKGGGAYPGKTNYLFSRTLEEPPEPGIQVVSARAEDFVRDLKNGPGGEICVMGGGEFAQVLFNAGLIDEVGANIHPLLLGAGIPLFQPLLGQIDLERISCEPLEGGCVYILYRVQTD